MRFLYKSRQTFTLGPDSRALSVKYFLFFEALPKSNPENQDKEAGSVEERVSDSDEESLVVDDVQEVFLPP